MHVLSNSVMLAGVRHGLLIGVAALVLLLPAIDLAKISVGLSGQSRLSTAAEKGAPRLADLGKEDASSEATYIANWVTDSRDNQNMSFVIIDKKNAKLLVFTADGRLIGAAPVLLGAMRGDDSVPGIGNRPIADVRPDERTTPAGRFVSEPGQNAGGESVIWVDYDAAVSMHRVRIVDPAQRRLERLATPTSDDNRISYGCINVPVAFFDEVLGPEFSARHGVVYVLPDIKPLREVFTTAYDPSQKFRQARIAVSGSHIW